MIEIAPNGGERSIMLEKQTLLRGVLLLIAALAALEFVQPAVMSIDVSALPGWQVQAVIVVQHFFTATPIALLAGFGWSIFGFLRYRFGDPTVQYELNRQYETFVWFEGIIIIVAAGLPTPLATAIAGVIMAVKSVFNALKNPPPPPTAPDVLTPQPQAQQQN